MASSWSRELLVADIALERGLAPLHAIAAGLQEFRTSSNASHAMAEDFLAAALKLDEDQARGLQEALEHRLKAAGGDARRALADAGESRRSLQLSMHAAAGPRRQDGESTEDTARLRSVGAERFSEPLLAGEGGMGLVYMVRDQELRRYVALKAIKAPADSGETRRPPPESPFEQTLPADGSEGAERYELLRRRFLNEARITGRLEHPGIVPVYEIGETPEGVSLYTMKFVSTHRTLADDIEAHVGRPVTERLALLEPFLKVCDAMEYAHSQGILHRDLKPSNVAIGEFGEALVLDWGLAKVHEESDEYAQEWPEGEHGTEGSSGNETPPMAIGTPGYMAPEAASGEHDKMGPHSDVYSLGAILYEILVGRLPHEVSSLHEWMHRLLQKDAPEPASINETVPGGLSAIAARAVDRDGARRPASAGALGNAIRAWQVADEETRELARLDRDARESLERAAEVHADERLRLLERAALRLQQIGEIRPDTPGLSERRETVERLRSKALRQRMWRLVRLPLAAAAVLAIAIAASNVWFEWRAIEDQLSAADEAIAQEQPHLVKQRASAALALVERSRSGLLPEALSRGQAESATRALFDAHVMRGDVSGLAHEVAGIFATARSAAERRHAQRLAAAAFAELGQFHPVRNLLRDLPSRSAQDNDRLLNAYQCLGDRAEAHALAVSLGDETTQALLARFAPLAEFELRGVRDVARAEFGGVPHLVLGTKNGSLYLWKTGEPRPKAIPYPGGMSHVYARGGASDRIVVHGRETPADGGRDHLAVLEWDPATKTARELLRDVHSTPELTSLDLDGDGEQEYLLSFRAQTRGVEVISLDGTPWPAARLGELARLKVSHEPTANVDIYRGFVWTGQDGRRSLMLGTGPWNRGELGYGLLKFDLGQGGEGIRLVGTHRVGVIEGLASADLDGDGEDECYLWNSYTPVVEFDPVHKDFLPLGVHRFDPETLAIKDSPVERSRHSGFYRDELGAPRVAGMAWRCDLLGRVRLPSGREAFVSAAYVEGRMIKRRQYYAELLLHDSGACRAWTIPIPGETTSLAAGALLDVIPEAPGEELVLVCETERVIVLGAAPEGVSASRGNDGGAQPPEAPLWLMAAGLRAAGEPGLAAELYETASYHSETDVDHADRWRRALRCRVEAADSARAAAALGEASAKNGIPRIERDVWDARIAKCDHRPEAALAFYRAALAGLGSTALRADLQARSSMETPAELEDEARREAERLAAAHHVWKQQWAFGAAAATPSGMPAAWTASHPFLTPTSATSDGVKLALDGRRGHALRIGVEVPEVESLRAWADVTIHKQPYGSQFCFAFSQSAQPATPGKDGALKDSIWAYLDRGDNTPRGVALRSRIKVDLGGHRLGDGAPYVWSWGRPLRVVFDYQRGAKPGEGRLRLRCIDRLNGTVLAEGETTGVGALRAGRYAFGFWGTPARNPWNRQTDCTIHQAGFEVRARVGPAARIVPLAPGTQHDAAGAVRTAWRAWEEGRRKAAVASLVAARPAVADLAHWLVGPRAQTPTGLVADCLRAVEGLEEEFFKQDADFGAALIGTDPALLVSLHEGGHLQTPLEERRMLLASAYVGMGRLREAWALLKPMDVGEDARFHLRTRLGKNVAAFEQEEAKAQSGEEDAPEPGTRLQRLKILIRGALALGREARARLYLKELMANAALAQEGLNDEPAIRRLLRLGK